MKIKKISAFVLAVCAVVVTAACTGGEGTDISGNSAISGHESFAGDVSGRFHVSIDPDDPESMFEPNKTILPTRQDAAKLRTGMTYEEVAAHIGKAERDIGSGLWIFEYNLDDGGVLLAWFYPDRSAEGIGYVLDTYRIEEKQNESSESDISTVSGVSEISETSE